MLKFKLYFLITLSVINVVESNGDNTVPHDDKTTFEWFSNISLAWRTMFW